VLARASLTTSADAIGLFAHIGASFVFIFFEGATSLDPRETARAGRAVIENKISEVISEVNLVSSIPHGGNRR